MTPAHFDALYADMMALPKASELFAKDLFGGADLTHRISVRIVTELPGIRCSSHQLLIRPSAEQLKNFDPEFTIIDLPSFNADPAKHGSASQTVIAVNFTKKTDPDRRHLLCRRNEEIGLHHPELPPAAQAGDADALLRQCRQGRKSGDFLRSFRHRQDHSVGGCLAHPGGR